MFPPPIHLPPLGYLQQTPPDPPVRPALTFDQEHLTFRLEGIFIGALLVFGLFFRWELLFGFGVMGALAAVYLYFDWSGNVARFRQQEELRVNGILMPPQVQQQHYFNQPILF